MAHVVGNETIVRLLFNRFANTVGHAYLFCGPRGVGKRHTARLLAASLLCEAPLGDGLPCEQCPPCRLVVQRKLHPDVIVLERTNQNDPVPVEAIRDFQHRVFLHPSKRGGKKVGIIENAERLTREAENALLKLLEEPPGRTTIVLTTNDEAALLPTIRSRCFIIRFSSVPMAVIEKALQTQSENSQAICRKIAMMSRGRPGMAFTLLHDPEARNSLEQSRRDARELLAGDRSSRLAYVDQRFRRSQEPSQRDSIRSNLQILLDILHETLIASVISQPRLRKRTDAMIHHRPWTEREIRLAIESIANAMIAIDANVHPRLAIEAALLIFPTV